MTPTIKTGTVGLLFSALDSRDAPAIRGAADAVLQSAYGHLVYDVEVPLDGDGAAMSTLLVSANAKQTRRTRGSRRN